MAFLKEDHQMYFIQLIIFVLKERYNICRRSREMAQGWGMCWNVNDQEPWFHPGHHMVPPPSPAKSDLCTPAQARHSLQALLGRTLQI